MALGEFDERFTVAWREDSDLFFSLLELHAKLVYAPEVVVGHVIIESCRRFSLGSSSTVHNST